MRGPDSKPLTLLSLPGGTRSALAPGGTHRGRRASPCWVPTCLPSPRLQDPSAYPNSRQTPDGGLAEWSRSTGGRGGKGIGWGLSAPHTINSPGPGCFSQRFRLTTEASALASWLDLPRAL